MNQKSTNLSSNRDIQRREFVKITGSVTVAAASWWGVTAKVDAQQQGGNQFKSGHGHDPGDPNYDYD